MLSEVHSGSLVSRSASHCVCPTRIPSGLSHRCHSLSLEEPFSWTPASVLSACPLSPQQRPRLFIAHFTAGVSQSPMCGNSWEKQGRDSWNQGLRRGTSEDRPQAGRLLSPRSLLLLLTDTAPPPSTFQLRAPHCRQEAKNEEIQSFPAAWAQPRGPSGLEPHCRILGSRTKEKAAGRWEGKDARDMTEARLSWELSSVEASRLFPAQETPDPGVACEGHPASQSTSFSSVGTPAVPLP